MSDPERRCGNGQLFLAFLGVLLWFVCLTCLGVIAAWILRAP